jgi:type II secretory ATPase GspE/PulE/Tfp pilus assembly ATPase PilB-like protein
MSPPSDRPGAKSTGQNYDLVLSHFPSDLTHRLDIEQIFILIDGVLPFEACLYHQLLPLYLEGSRLHLGMVSPEDQTGADYARRIVSYLNYSLVTQTISSEALQATLSAYLNHASTRQAGVNPNAPAPQPSPGISEKPEESPQSDRQTLIVDSPDDLDPLESDRDLALPPPPQPAPPPPSAPPPSPSPALSSNSPPTATARRAALFNQPPPLHIHPQHPDSPVEVLQALPPKELLQELLGRILNDGIGRLYFEQQQQFGRVLCSQNGVLQTILEHIDTALVQSLIYELKLLAHLPSTPLQAPEQVEIERSYQHAHILLRFRFMPSKHGEEATVQVLRGAALKFYQQQQLSRLGRDALSIAKQLQFKVNEIRERALSEPGLIQARIEALASLSETLRAIETQVADLQDTDPSPPVNPPSPAIGEDETLYYD